LAGSLSEPILISVTDLGALCLTGGLFRSNEYISNLFAARLSRSPRAVLRRRTSAELFGGMIRRAREDKGLSLEETAPRAGMTPARWEAMEEGKVPETREQLVAIAEALEADLDAIVALAVLCRQAWGR
jgi:hypothetical protein